MINNQHHYHYPYSTPRLYAFLMESFSEEQKIAATARIGQDILSYALEVYTHIDTNQGMSNQGLNNNGMNTGSGDNNNNSSSSSSSSHDNDDVLPSSHLHPLNEALEDAFCILQSPLSKVGLC